MNRPFSPDHSLTRRTFLRGLGGTAALTLASMPSSRARAQSRTDVTIGYVPGSIGFADVFVAQERGLFADAGLNVELVAFLNGALAHNALANGSVDVAPLAGGYVPFVRPTGLQTRQVAARTERNPFSLLARTDLQDEVTSVADLRGRRLAVEALGSSITWAMGVNYLARAGLNFERDVELIATNSRAAAVSALRGGRVDAAVLDGPSDEQLVQAGDAVRLVDPIDPSDHLKWVGNAREDALAWLARQDTVNDRPDALQALVDAGSQALSFLNERREAGDVASVADAVAPFFEELDRRLLEASLERHLQTIAPEASLSWLAYYADLVKWTSLELVQPLSFEEAVTVDFAGVRA
ncbi:MAG: ABC transporter substrate-binding protein [Salinibacter sp.]